MEPLGNHALHCRDSGRQRAGTGVVGATECGVGGYLVPTRAVCPAAIVPCLRSTEPHRAGQRLFGRLGGAATTGVLIGGIVWFALGVLAVAFVAALVVVPATVRVPERLTVDS